MSDLSLQVEEIRQLLKSDPGNKELQDALRDLEEAVELVKQAEEPPERRYVAKPIVRSENPLIGKTCEVPHEAAWLTARIISSTGESVRVQFIAQAVTNEYPLANIKVLTALEPRLCTTGAKLQAIWPKDGHWYDCEVVAMKPDGYLVAFEGYKERIEVKPEHLRKRKITKSADPVEEYVTPSGYRIPEILKITEKDTEKVKEEKKRKIHQIKQQQRIGKQDEEATERQNAWKAFNKKIKR